MTCELSLRSPTGADFDDIVRVFAAQDLAWWNEVDGDADDVRSELERATAAGGTLTAAARVCVLGPAVVGVALLVGHGETNVAVDGTATASRPVLELLVDWLLDAAATDFDTPSHDAVRRSVLESRGLRPTRSSFELERSGPLDDLGATVWPGGIEPASFRLGTDDQEVHDLIYSVWTDVAGHHHRPIEEWRSLFLSGAWFDPHLVVVARDRDSAGRAAGVSLCRTFTDEIGWVSQLAVGRDHQGRGLGRALLVESLHRLASRDVERFGLNVEAQNATALGLYRSVGFQPTREWVHFSADR